MVLVLVLDEMCLRPRPRSIWLCGHWTRTGSDTVLSCKDTPCPGKCFPRYAFYSIFTSASARSTNGDDCRGAVTAVVLYCTRINQTVRTIMSMYYRRPETVSRC